MRLKDLVEFWNLPSLKINLMLEKTAENEPFYAAAVRHFYKQAVSLNPRLLFAARKYEFGFAVCPLGQNFETYLMKLEASARRKYKKALRLGYQFKRFDYNSHL